MIFVKLIKILIDKDQQFVIKPGQTSENQILNF